MLIIYNTDISFEFGFICVWVMVFLAVPTECTFIQSCGGGMLGESWYLFLEVLNSSAFVGFLIPVPFRKQEVLACFKHYIMDIVFC